MTPSAERSARSRTRPPGADSVAKVTWFSDEVPIILGSAHRHGVPDEDIRHSLDHHLDAFDVGEGMTMVIGPDRAATPIESGVVELYGGWCVVHAMRPARARFLRR